MLKPSILGQPPSSLAKRIRRVATFLRAIGIRVEERREGKAGKRVYEIIKGGEIPVSAVSPVSYEAQTDTPCCFPGQERLTANGSGLTGDMSVCQFPSANKLPDLGHNPTMADVTDTADGKIPAIEKYLLDAEAF